VSEVWVVNASPLILFSRIGRLDLIERLTSEILIPNAVIEEVRAGQAKDPSAALALQWASKYRAHDVQVMPSIERWDLGAGESQVIAHSAGTARWAVLDDRAARRCAVAHGVPVIGSLGVVLRSKKKRHLDRARPLIEALIAAGMFMDDDFIHRALENVAE
jgi:predicted nucleic acid-binding protein